MLSRSLSVACAAVLAGGVSVAAHAQGNLTVARYGGTWGDALQSCIFDKFAEKTGVNITPEPGVSTVTLSKLKQQKDNPAIDVAWIDGGVSELALESDVVATFDKSDVPNVENVVPEGTYRTADGEIYALGTGWYSLGLVYSTNEVQPAPSSWWDLWKPEYAGVVTVPSPANAMGVPLFVHISKLLGGDMNNMDAAVKKFQELEVSSFFDTSGSATNSFQSGEVIVGGHYANAAWAMADKGLPIAYAVPKEGAPSGDIRVHIVKGAKNRDLAEEFVNFAVAKEQATCLVEKLYVGPATKGVTPSEAASKRLPWGANGSVDNLALFDWAKLNAKRDDLTQLWNREVAGQ